MAIRSEYVKPWTLATVAVVDSIKEPRRFEKRFRTCFTAGLKYTSVMYGVPISIKGMELATHMMNAGILVNDHYDTNNLDIPQYIAETAPIREDEFAKRQFHQYFQVIRKLEKQRPQPGETKACIDYREKTNLISLAINTSLAFEIPINNLITIDNRQNPEFSEATPGWFISLYNIIMALQVVDDLVGSKGDSLHRRPSFFTAYGSLTQEELKEKRISDEKLYTLKNVFDNYVTAAQTTDKIFVDPLVFLSKTLLRYYPKLVLILKTPYFERLFEHLFSSRDFYDQ